jgi:DNA-binding NtrC family response regulator
MEAELIGQSPEIRRIFELVEKVGCTEAPVLVTGETGTGKELVARAIHRVQAKGPFVPIDCSALPPGLWESELFGYVRGAFTGASGGKVGLVELADGGTAFFDEIGEVPLEFQPKLLRLLQEREYRPVGSVTWRKTRFRVVAATNRDLARAVEMNTFRADLYYRLSVVEIRLPPLRERRDDIPLLVEHFLRQHGCGHSMSRECLEAMMAYDWPGNVRELENVIRRMVVTSSTRVLRPADLPAAVRFASLQRKGPSRSLYPGGEERGELDAAQAVCSIAEVERKAILGALEYARGRKTMAASLLGIGRSTLYRRLRQYQMIR